jgi:nicotinate phosphoribosyltransferase
MINSLLELDYYKLTMGQFVWKLFPEVRVKYAFTNRTKDVKLGYLSYLLQEEIKRIQTLKFTETDILFLKMQNTFSDEYLDFLQNLKFPDVYVDTNIGGDLIIEIDALWKDSILWETIILGAVNELYYHHDMVVHSELKIGHDKLIEKIKLLKEYPELQFVDFGTRRAYSAQWHDHVLKVLLDEIPNQIAGTSNVFLAKKYGIKPIGSMAHEIFSAGARLFGDTDFDILRSHNQMFDMWFDMYGYPLSIALTDTYGSDYTFRTFGEQRAKQWKGMRQDSGDPFGFCKKQIKMYNTFGIDSKTKWFVPSDGLDVPKMIALWKEFHDKINILPAIGTNLTNDLVRKPISIVMKVVECNGQGCVKLSDNLNKAISEHKEDVEKFKRIFDYTNTSSEPCIY